MNIRFEVSTTFEFVGIEVWNLYLMEVDNVFMAESAEDFCFVPQEP